MVGINGNGNGEEVKNQCGDIEQGERKVEGDGGQHCTSTIPKSALAVSSGGVDCEGQLGNGTSHALPARLPTGDTVHAFESY
jgi:hypothetical protein